MTNTRTWDNLVLERRIEFGYAAHGNRGSYTGTKIHRILAEYIIGRVDETKAPAPKTLEARFVMSGKPVLFAAFPCCGCTNGQYAARPDARFTKDNVTCSRCR